MSTDADVLSVRVQLADMQQREIQARYAVDVARAALNDALGAPLDTVHELSTRLMAATLPNIGEPDLDQRAVENRPDSRQALLAVRAADAQSQTARAALFPRITIRGAFEA